MIISNIYLIRKKGGKKTSEACTDDEIYVINAQITTAQQSKQQVGVNLTKLQF